VEKSTIYLIDGGFLLPIKVLLAKKVITSFPATVT